MSNIKIINAAEGNLKHISIEIPKNQLVVFTGLSGSGKSTLLVDVLFNECQRQYLEAMAMQGIRKPQVERIQGISPAIVISQNHENRNPRSTVGTMTDVYTDLRMIYEKLAVRRCPYCGKMISSAACKEETEKIGTDFFVYMYCSECGKRMKKLTRTEFSFNTKEGACPTCEGLGTVHRIRTEAVVDEALSLEEGAVRYWEKQYGKYQISVLYAAYRHYGIPVPEGLPVGKFSAIQKALLYHGADCEQVREAFPDKNPPKTVAAGRFEGVYPILWRRFVEKEGDSKRLEPFFETAPCPDCKGERLRQESRSASVQGTRLPELAGYSLEQLREWTEELQKKLSDRENALVEAYLRDILTKIRRMEKVGLGYLSLDRQIITLSGGEMQRLRLAAVLDSDLSGIIYILDEPTAGLHPRDTEGLVEILRKLRDLENTVLVIEHDPDVMAAADYLVDMGPGAGRYGGEIVAKGTLKELLTNENSVTGSYLRSAEASIATSVELSSGGETVARIFAEGRRRSRKERGGIRIENADTFNLQQIDVEIPTGCMTAVTGPSGSGKSTLVFEVLAKGAGNQTEHNRVYGLEQFDRIVEIGQASVTKMRRSNVATFSGVYAEIRTLFAKTEAAKKAGLTAKHFSFNTSGGRCENCEGLGYVESNMLFFLNTEITCPVCGGDRFCREVLAVTYKGHSIKDVLDMSVDEAAELFAEQPKIRRILELLREVGLGYLELGQSLTTLSGGEGQRMKLAKELTENDNRKKSKKTNLYLLDEPTTGLHPWDVEHFLKLLDRLVDAGNTVIVVEHNRQLIERCNWVIDLGPEGGAKGGRIQYEGRPKRDLGGTHEADK